MFGAVITSSSRMMAKGRPTLSWVTRANFRVPVLSNVKNTAGPPLRWSEPGLALDRFSPETSTLRLTI